jgi:hypothetical protein
MVAGSGLGDPEEALAWLAVGAAAALDEGLAGVADLERAGVLDEQRETEDLAAEAGRRVVAVEPVPDVDHVGHRGGGVPRPGDRWLSVARLARGVRRQEGQAAKNRSGANCPIAGQRESAGDKSGAV